MGAELHPATGLRRGSRAGGTRWWGELALAATVGRCPAHARGRRGSCEPTATLLPGRAFERKGFTRPGVHGWSGCGAERQVAVASAPAGSWHPAAWSGGKRDPDPAVHSGRQRLVLGWARPLPWRIHLCSIDSGDLAVYAMTVLL
jgi:hypothetical protein